MATYDELSASSAVNKRVALLPERRSLDLKPICAMRICYLIQLAGLTGVPLSVSQSTRPAQ